MGKVYDDWERLVEAVLRREKFRQLCYAHSRTPSHTSSDSSSRLDDDKETTSSLHLHAKMAMVRIQEELISTLTENYKQCFDLPSTCEKDSIYEESVALVEHYLRNAPPRQSCCSNETEEYVLDLLHPDVIPLIKSIANTLFASHRDQEFLQAFVGFGRGAFTVYLTILDVEEVSSEDVHKMELECFNSRTKKWFLSIKSFISLYLPNAKHQFDQVMEEHGHISSTCLIKASKASLTCFLNLSRAIAFGLHQREHIFYLLDMYENLASLIPDVEALFPEDIDSCIRMEFYNLLTRLGDSAKVILKELVNRIGFNPSTIPFPNGGIHPLSRYVKNYILLLTKYARSLNLLLEEKDVEDLNEEPNEDLEQSSCGPVAAYVQSITSVLEANIDSKSNLYKDSSLKHIFLLNNIHYMVGRIRNSESETYFGDEWIKSQIRKFQFHAMSYQRNTWSSKLPFLCHDRKIDRETLKARCRDFHIAFKNVYKNQTGWRVPDHHLREELRISTSINVVRSYQCFVMKTTRIISDKHIKYTAHDLENYILDLFQGSSKSLNPSQKGKKT